MRKLIINLSLIVAALVCAQTAQAQAVSNDNEDGVYKVTRYAGQNAYVPGQLLVKFKDATPVTVKQVRGKFQSASRSEVNTLLQQFGVESMTKLFPKAKNTPPTSSGALKPSMAAR